MCADSPQLFVVEVSYLGGQSHSSRREQITSCGLRGHQTDLGLVDEGKEILDFLLEGWLLFVLSGVWVGSLIASVCIAEGRHL